MSSPSPLSGSGPRGARVPSRHLQGRAGSALSSVVRGLSRLAGWSRGVFCRTGRGLSHGCGSGVRVHRQRPCRLARSPGALADALLALLSDARRMRACRLATRPCIDAVHRQARRRLAFRGIYLGYVPLPGCTRRQVGGAAGRCQFARPTAEIMCRALDHIAEPRRAAGRRPAGSLPPPRPPEHTPPGPVRRRPGETRWAAPPSEEGAAAPSGGVRSGVRRPATASDLWPCALVLSPLLGCWPLWIVLLFDPRLPAFMAPPQ